MQTGKQAADDAVAPMSVTEPRGDIIQSGGVPHPTPSGKPDWLKTKGEAIYGTRPIAPYESRDIRFTARGQRTYAILLRTENATASATGGVVQGLQSRAGTDVRALGWSAALPWHGAAAGFTVDPPALPRHDLPALVLACER
jgi:hypothetical protein